jgi:hypothetical protein
MIKFAVTRPKQRLEAINHGCGMLKWNEDPYMAHFGMKVDPAMTVVGCSSQTLIFISDFSQDCSSSSPKSRGPVCW